MLLSFTLIFMEFALVGNNQTPAKLNRSTEYFSSLVWWAEYFLPTSARPHLGQAYPTGTNGCVSDLYLINVMS